MYLADGTYLVESSNIIPFGNGIPQAYDLFGKGSTFESLELKTSCKDAKVHPDGWDFLGTLIILLKTSSSVVTSPTEYESNTTCLHFGCSLFRLPKLTPAMVSFTLYKCLYN